MNRKEELICSAIRIIDETGYQNFTIRELAKNNNISEAAIYRYFASKTEIINAVLDMYCRFFDSVRQKIETEKMNAVDAAEYYILSIADYYEKYPCMLTISNSFDFLSREKEISQLVMEIVNERFQYLKELFQKGIDQKEFDGSISAGTMADVVIGTMNFVALKWKLDAYSFSLKGKVKLILREMSGKIVSPRH